VLVLRAAQHSVSEIAETLAAEGTPVSAQTVWQILSAEGLPRLARRDDSHRGSPVTAGRDQVRSAARLARRPRPAL
jgi:hypothetical protein